MMPAICFVTPDSEHLAGAFAAAGFEIGSAEFRKFPDGESHVRLKTSVAGRRVVILSALHDPDKRLMGVLLAAAAAREGGADDVGLVVPYLPYMRQDASFHPGEPVSARHFARILSLAADWIVTLDPHLHRIKTLDELFVPIRSRSLTASSAIADWISASIPDPLIIGPDSESGQWAIPVARQIGAPVLIAEKKRSGDRAVSFDLSGFVQWSDRQPVIVDDIVSTGTTMAVLIRALISMGMAPPVCCCVHPLFTEGAMENLKQSGALRLVSCNTIPHSSNQIEIGGLLAQGARDFLTPAPE